jgi:hypothetical protein
MKFEVLMVVNITITGCDAVYFGTEVRTFRSKVLPPASGWKTEEASSSEMLVLLTSLGDVTSHKTVKN